MDLLLQTCRCRVSVRMCAILALALLFLAQFPLGDAAKSLKSSSLLHHKPFNIKGQVLGWWYTRKVVLNEPAGDIAPPTAATATDVASSYQSSQLTASALVSQLRYNMLQMKGTFMSADGSSVDYKAMENSAQMDEYIALVQQLGNVPLKALSGEAEKKAFFINIYNTLTIHALCKSDLLPVRKASSTLGRLKLYASAAYVIDHAVYSLNDIENGVLRGNKPSAAPFTKPPFPVSDALTDSSSSSSDPRSQHVLNCDPRIHFALNCGAASCPPIAVYSHEDADELDAQLQLATEGFIATEVRCDAAQCCVYLSKIFDWYKEDFVQDYDKKNALGGSALQSDNMKLLHWIIDNADDLDRSRITQFLNDCAPKDPKFKFAAYDWSMNTSS